MVRASMVPMLLVCCGLAAQAPVPPSQPLIPAVVPASKAAMTGVSGQAKRLSLRDALETALKYNLQVDISQEQRKVTQAGILINEGPFDWNLNLSVTTGRTETASSTPATKATPVQSIYGLTNYNRSAVADLNKAFVWGGSIDLNYSPVYSGYDNNVSNGLISSPPPVYGNYSTSNPVPYQGGFTAKYSQNLLQGFGQEVTTAPLVIARKSAEGADYTFQLAIINLMSSTEAQYWAVVYAQKNLANGQTALKLAQKQLDENNIRLKVGTMAPLDVISAEAGVAQAEQNIITYQAALDNAKDALIVALYPDAERPASLEPTDEPTLSHIQLNEDAAVKMALERRLELKALKVTQDIDQLKLTLAQDKVRPQLSAFGAYNGSSNTYAALGPVNSDLAGMKYPGYTVGLTFAMPIQNRAAKGGLDAARATFRQDELGLRSQELGVTLQVRQAVRNIDATEKGVKAAEKTRILKEKTLEAEQKKFDNGMSTNFIVLQDMTDLDAARSAETQAQVAYATAVTALEVAVGDLLEARNFKIQ